MRYRSFGRLGWQVSEIGFGGWAIGGGWGAQDQEDSLKSLHRSLDLGCNFIDTAQGYGDGKSERIIAQVLKDRGDQNVYVATKIPPKSPGDWPPSPYDRCEDRFPEDYVRERVERSLRDLNTDCIDLIQLHTWTRAWNKNPTVLEVLRKFQQQGKVKGIGISTPEHDQNSLVELMEKGWLDAVQVIYNIFEQEPQAEFFPVAEATKVGVIVRVPFDESALTGKLTSQTKFGPGDFRSNYFAGDRLDRTVKRVERIREIVSNQEKDLATASLKFCLKPPAVSTVIPGIRNEQQAEANCGVGYQPAMSDELELKLRECNWRRAFWYGGK